MRLKFIKKYILFVFNLLFFYYLLFFLDIQENLYLKIILSPILYSLIFFKIIQFSLHFNRRKRKYYYSFIENIYIFYISINYKNIYSPIKKFYLFYKKRNKKYIEILNTIFFTFLFTLHIKFYIFQIFTVQYNSMIPTLYPNDKIIIEKITMGLLLPKYKQARNNIERLSILRFRLLKNNDLIIFSLTNKQNKNIYIKRIIAGPNDTIQLLKNNKIAINGKTIKKKYNNLLPDKILKKYTKNKAITIPPKMYYVLGDNKNASQDSRFWGFIPQEKIIGRVIYIYK